MMNAKNVLRGVTSTLNTSVVKPRTKLLTLFFAFKDASRSEVLLGYKKQGFGAGRYNGFGGKVEPGETIRKAAIRELNEECGLVVEPDDVQQVGRIHFEFVGDPVWMDVHVFAADKYTGTVTESDEMRPTWFSADLAKMPFGTMWPDDHYWYPFLFAREPFFAYFQFLGHDKVLRYSIKQLPAACCDGDFGDTKVPWYHDENAENADLVILK